jgi:hypothetical protein
MERLMEEHLAKLKRLEQEKADIAAENYKRLEDQQREFAQEAEKLKDKHRSVRKGKWSLITSLYPILPAVNLFTYTGLKNACTFFFFFNLMSSSCRLP